MGLDLGGSGVRCLLVDVESGETVTAARAAPRSAAAGTGGTGADLDAAACWVLLAEAAREALARTQARPAEVAGIAATSMRFSLVLLDREGRELVAIPNADGRALGQAQKLAADAGELLHRRTGH